MHIDDSEIKISDPDSQLVIKASPKKYKKVSKSSFPRPSKDGKIRYFEREFKSIYERINESEIFCIDIGRVFIEQFDHNGLPTSSFYATKQKNGKFIEAIQYEPLKSIKGYGNPRIKDVVFDKSGNAYMSYTYFQYEDDRKPRFLSYISKFNSYGENIFSNQIITEGFSYG